MDPINPQANTPAPQAVPPTPTPAPTPVNQAAQAAANMASSAASGAANMAASAASSAASAAGNMAKNLASSIPVPKLCKCPTVNAADWDKKKQTINKTFYKAFSPRIFSYPFSFVIDVLRAQKGALAKGYKPVENGMVLDDGSKFFGSVMIEVTGANTNDPDVYSLEGKEVYTKVSRKNMMQVKGDIAELEKELGKKPAQLFIWWTSCTICMLTKDVKAVLIALP